MEPFFNTFEVGIESNCWTWGSQTYTDPPVLDWSLIGRFRPFQLEVVCLKEKTGKNAVKSAANHEQDDSFSWRGCLCQTHRNHRGDPRQIFCAPRRTTSVWKNANAWGVTPTDGTGITATGRAVFNQAPIYQGLQGDLFGGSE